MEAYWIVRKYLEAQGFEVAPSELARRPDGMVFKVSDGGSHDVTIGIVGHKVIIPWHDNINLHEPDSLKKLVDQLCHYYDFRKRHKDSEEK